MVRWSSILDQASGGNPPAKGRVEKSVDEWKEVLTPEQFRVTRLAGTERAFSSEMCSLFEPGRYQCACCQAPLFDATQKFESGSGWPSFTEPVAEGAVWYHSDDSHGMIRIEVTCARCDAHLGHVFPDGPGPTGLRYCINAVALQKEE